MEQKNSGASLAFIKSFGEENGAEIDYLLCRRRQRRNIDNDREEGSRRPARFTLSLSQSLTPPPPAPRLPPPYTDAAFLATATPPHIHPAREQTQPRRAG